MQNELLALIDQVQMQTEDAECEVLESMMEVYTKSMIIMENSQDTSGFELFLEADENKETDEKSNKKKESKETSLRSKNVFAKLVRFVKRLWQQIMTMVSSAILHKSIRTLRKYMDHAVNDNIPVPFASLDGKGETYFEKETKYINDAARIHRQNMIGSSPSTLLSYIDGMEIYKHHHDERVNKNKGKPEEKLGTSDFIDKKIIRDYLDANENYFKTIKEIGKMIDKYIDNHFTQFTDKSGKTHVRNNEDLTPEEQQVKRIDENTTMRTVGKYTESKLNNEDMRKLNNATEIIFKYLRARMADFKIEVDKLIDQFRRIDSVICKSEVTVQDLKITVQSMLMHNKTHKDSHYYSFYVFDPDIAHDPAVKNLMRDPKYSMYTMSVDDYPKQLVFTLLNTKEPKKTWNLTMRVINCKSFDSAVTKLLGPKGAVVIEPNDPRL